MGLLAHEWLTLAYVVAGLAVAGLGLAGRAHARSVVPAGAALLAVVMLAARFVPDAGRLWLGHVYLAGGYWLPALLRSREADAQFTAWLVRVDERLPQMAARIPAWVAHLADICYLLCYPLVPAGYAALAWQGTIADQERFWVAVLGAGFACYATLPWLVSLPPRRTATAEAGERLVGRFNVAVLERVSHGFNTFPSGHAAVSTAVALATIPVPAIALACAAVATGVAVGAVVGRHHFVVDVVTGIAVGAAASLIAFAAF